MKLHEKLHLTLTDTVAVIGAGGKTTALWRLAEERRGQNVRVLVTTSTHIQIPAPDACDTFLSPETAEALLAACGGGKSVCAGYACEDGKCTGCPRLCLSPRSRPGCTRSMKPTGAGKLPAKLHRAGEPVIHPGTGKILLLAGLRALGRPVAEVCHRYALSPRMAADPTRAFDADDLLETIHDGIRGKRRTGAPPADFNQSGGHAKPLRRGPAHPARAS